MKKRRMHIILKLLAGLMLFTGLLLGSVCTKAYASSVTTPFEGDLTTDKTFIRPQTTGDIDTKYTLVYYYPTDIKEGGGDDYKRNYFVIKLVPSVSGGYTIAVTSTDLKTTTGGGTDDTFLLLYSGGFDASKPLTNLVCANDDTPTNDGSTNGLSTLSNVSMTAGKEYYIVMTSFANGVTGDVEFTVTGPGAVSVVAANAYAVSYNANGGSGAPTDSNSYYKDDTITLAGGSGMTKTGYTFGGWSLTQNGTAISGSTYTMGTASLTFYAVWNAATPSYTVAYDANGGSGAPTDNNTYHQGASITLAATSGVSRTHYSITGWSTTVTGSAITTATYPMGSQNMIFYAVWAENSKYTVAYAANTGSGSAPTDSSQYYQGDVITLQGAGGLSKAHYTFSGWATTATGSAITTGSYTMATQNVTFYAIWTENSKYSVTYSLNGGSGTLPSDSNQYYQGDSVTLQSATLTKEHYIFKGWSDSVSGSAITGSTYAMGTQNVTFYAVWQENPKHMVSYNANTGSGSAPSDSTQYYEGEEITLKTAGSLTKTHYTFQGWSTTASGSALTTATYPMGTQNITFYAVWTENPKYTVDYNANTGSGSAPSDSTQYYEGEEITLETAGSLTKTHYTFQGWSTTTTGSAITTAAYPMGTQNITFYAVWQENPKYTVSYNANTGSGSAPSDNTQYYEGEEITLKTAGSLTKTHYTFQGWSTTTSGSALTTATYPMGTQNVTFYAVWQENPKYTVSYNANAGSGSAPSDSTQYYEGEEITLKTAGSLSKTHYTFQGWATTTTGSAITTAAYPMGTQNVTFYAVWQENLKYTVSYNANTGSGSAPSDSTQYYEGEEITLKTAGSLTKTHYTFQGWATTTTGSAITTAAYPMGTQNVIFYAVWQEDPKYTVTYDANAGSGSTPSDSTQYYQGDAITLKTAGSLTKTHYTFQGWSTTASGSALTTATYPMGTQNVTFYAVWQENLKYTVSYNANTGSGSAPLDSTQYYEGEAITLKIAGTLTKTHYTFQGWSTTTTGSVITTAVYPMGTQNVTFYAVWQENQKYTVSYNANTGSGSVPSDSTQYYEGEAVTLKTVGSLSKIHYTFQGWSTTASGSALTTATYPMGTQNVTFYAVWQENPKYTVTYYANTGSGSAPSDSTQYYEGEEITLKTAGTLSKTHYTFQGWSTTATGSAITTAVYPMGTQNVTFYAVWQENQKYTVSYNANTGSGSAPSDSTQYYEGEAITLKTAGTLSKTHYTFQGWSTTTTGSALTTATYPMGTQNVTFYAVWQENPKYTVTYYANTGSGSAPSDSTQYYEGEEITLKTAGTLSKTHYTFQGWSTTTTGSVITTAAYPMGTQNVTFYAVWTENQKYTVDYNANTGSGSAPSDSTQYYEGEAITLKTMGSLTKTHYTFQGWSTTTTGSVITTATYPMGTQNVTFYAVWQENPKYTVTYYANGGSGSATSDSTQYYEGEEITLKTAGSLTKTHYTFQGWATTATGSAVYTVSYIMEAHNADLYAIWSENPKYTVTYDANTGTGSAPSETTQYYEGEEVTLKTAGSLTKAHYAFRGWATTASGSAITTSAYTVGTQNITFYAVWEEDPKYTVTYHTNGGNGTVPVDSTLYYQADAVTLASGENLNKLHHTFRGWSTTVSGSAITTATYPVGSQNIDLYAVWTENPKYTVTYNANTGTGTVPVDTSLYYEGETIFFKTAYFTKEGYILGGWAISADGGNIGSTSYTMGSKNLTFYAVWTPQTSSTVSSGPAAPITTDPNVRQVNVNGGDSTGTNTVATVDIVRSVSDNTKTDSVVMDQDKTEEVLKKVIEQKQDLVQVVIDDVVNDQADAVLVTVKQASIDKLSEKDITLEIKTEDVTIQLPKETVQSLSETEDDLYFRVVPIRNEEDKTEAKQNAITAGVVLQTAGNSEVVALGTPMTIETNYQNMTTKVVFSLKNITIPGNAESREAFLSSLAVYIQHSDGDEEVNHGTIAYDTEGNPVGIEIEISKFSTFTIVSITNKAPVASKLSVKGIVAAGKTITAAYTYSDTENDAEGKSKIQWYRADSKSGKNKTKISGATKLAYKVTAKDKGKYLIVEVTPVAASGELTGKKVSASVKVTTVNEAPKADNVKIAGDVIVGNTLIASYRYRDAENNKESTSVYQWYSADNENGDNLQKITGATKLTYTITEEELGKYLIFKVTPVAKTGSKKGSTSPCITKAKVIAQKSEYNCNVLLGLIKNKAYAESVAKLFETDYDTANVEIKQEGFYYRIYIDFKDKKSAEAACEDMISRKYIINYYYYTK